MASKIHTNNPKHHKYTTVNKKERKKNKINPLFNDKTKPFNLKNFLITLEPFIIKTSYYFQFKNAFYSFCRKINNGYRTIYRTPNYHSSFGHNIGESSIYHGAKGCKIIYDDCNHKTYRVIKNGKFITDVYKNKLYGHSYIAPKHFKMR